MAEENPDAPLPDDFTGNNAPDSFPPAPSLYGYPPPAQGYPQNPGYPYGPPGAYGYPQPPYGTPYPGVLWGPPAPTEKPGFVLSIIALVIGVIPCCLGLVVAVPLAIFALVKANGKPNTGATKAMAWIAIAASVLWTVFTVIIMLVGDTQQVERDASGEIVKEGHLSTGDMREGDCISNLNERPGVSHGVPCSQPHQYVVSRLLYPPGDSWQESQVTDEVLSQRCGPDVVRWGVPDIDSPFRDDDPVVCLELSRN